MTPEPTKISEDNPPPKAGSAEWYRRRAEEVRHNGKTVSQYNYFLGIAEAIEITRDAQKPNPPTQ